MDTAEDMYQWLEAAAVSGEEIGLVVNEGISASELFLTVTRLNGDYLFGKTERVASICISVDSIISAYTKPVTPTAAGTAATTDPDAVIN